MIAALRRLPVLETIVLVAATLVLIVAGALREGAGSGAVALDSFSTYDASSGGYRAWYEVLEREGVAVERFERRPAFLDASLETLVWAEPLTFDSRQGHTTRADAAALESWVRAGGHLLYLGHDDAAATAGVLHLPRSRSAAGGGRTFGVAPSLRAAGVARVVASAPLRWQPRRDARALVFDRAGPLVLAYALGHGRVVAVIDEQLFANGSIARGERARLAYALARPARATGRVAFDEAVHGYVVAQHWWSILPWPLALALALAGVALASGSIPAALRLGPPLQPAASTDRSSADFVEAVAVLLERGAAAATALDDATRSTTRALARALGNSEGDSREQIAARLDGAGARADFERMLALGASPTPSDANFVRGVALAQQLRKECTAHARSRY